MPILTEIRIRAARPGDRAYKLYDVRGLYMLVTPTGGKLWRFKYRMNGVEKLLTLGKYPDVSSDPLGMFLTFGSGSNKYCR
jgi:Arm DNA-binding domain